MQRVPSASRPALRGAARLATAESGPRLAVMALVPLLLALLLASCAPAGQPKGLGDNLTKPATPTNAPTSTASATATSTPYPATRIPGWTLVWSDEFDGRSLDTTKWTVVSDAPGGYHNCCLNNTLNAWAPDDVAITGGALRLTTERRGFLGQQYTSGAVTTQGKMGFLYGRLEMRARVPKGNGLWPAFWLLPTDMHGTGYASYEVDMMEALGEDTHTDYMVDWVGTRHRYCQYRGPDFSAGYHVYSFIWTPTALTWLIDGVERCTFTQGMPTTPMYLILNTRIGGSWPVPPDASTILPQYTDVDYVRLYAAAAATPSPTPTTTRQS